LWKLAEDVFLSSYPAPAEIKELEQLIVAKSNRNPSRLQPAILDILKRRFRAFAGNSRNHTHADNSANQKCDCGKQATDRIDDLWVCVRCKELLANLPDLTR
jgi:hypothetical protein